jgi:preprotein translocase subunit SecG
LLKIVYLFNLNIKDKGGKEMITFIMVIHALVCILLACIILMQSGRGGGLTESFASAESIFGAQTNTLLVKTTTILGSLFIVTCLSLAIFHSMKGKSLMSERVAVPARASMPASADPIQQAADSVSKETAAQTQAVEGKADQAVSDIKQVEPVTPAATK